MYGNVDIDLKLSLSTYYVFYEGYLARAALKIVSQRMNNLKRGGSEGEESVICIIFNR
jgi:hypothetical protein